MFSYRVQVDLKLCVGIWLLRLCNYSISLGNYMSLSVLRCAWFVNVSLGYYFVFLCPSSV